MKTPTKIIFALVVVILVIAIKLAVHNLWNINKYSGDKLDDIEKHVYNYLYEEYPENKFNITWVMDEAAETEGTVIYKPCLTTKYRVTVETVGDYGSEFDVIYSCSKKKIVSDNFNNKRVSKNGIVTRLSEEHSIKVRRMSTIDTGWQANIRYSVDNTEMLKEDTKLDNFIGDSSIKKTSKIRIRVLGEGIDTEKLIEDIISINNTLISNGIQEEEITEYVYENRLSYHLGDVEVVFKNPRNVTQDILGIRGLDIKSLIPQADKYRKIVLDSEDIKVTLVRR